MGKITLLRKEPLKPAAATRQGHSGIAGPWAWTLDSEMLDSGPIFPEILVQKHTKSAASMY